MNPLTEKSIVCPYCGESIDVLLDLSDMEQSYIEDCQVCCRPMTLEVSESANGDLDVAVYSEDESY